MPYSAMQIRVEHDGSPESHRRAFALLEQIQAEGLDAVADVDGVRLEGSGEEPAISFHGMPVEIHHYDL